MGTVVCATQAVTAVLYIAPILILENGGGASQPLALMFVKWSGYAFDSDLVFFGFWCVLTGYLIVGSKFLPRVLGVLLVIDGIGWILYLWPPFAGSVFPLIAAASAIAEIPLQLWLVIVGLNEQRWWEQAAGNPAT